MKIYKETSSDEVIKISENDFSDIILDIEILCNKLHSYCTSDKAYRSMSNVVDKEGR